MRPLHEQFLLNAKRFRSKPAIIDRFTEKTYTYERALIASILLAQQIKVTHEGMIGIMLPTGAGCMLSILGVLMSGKIPVMINYSTNAAENCAYAQNKCGFRTVITSKAFIEKIDCRAVHGMRFIEDMLASIGTLARVQAALKCKLPTRLLLASLPAVQLDDTVVILFTSGSEKDPKAVQLTHRNIGSNVRDVINSLDIGAHDIFMSNLPLFHVFGHNIDFWLPLCLGATMVTYPNPLDYRRICQIVREQKATLMVGTPAFFSGYLRQSQPGDFASLRVVVAGADKL
ncbi:MAG: AMP-binding protein, partial [Vicinamibacteria bacterium]|nr:AMP-binding protein [Vicinamibacteria bacterium]